VTDLSKQVENTVTGSDEAASSEDLKKKHKKPNAVQDFFARMGIMGELFGFLWKRKLYWLIPMILTLFIFALLIILGNAGGIAPFVYTLW
jgi:hypothetical protein